MSDSDENVPTKTKKSAERHVRRRKKRHRKERKSRDKSEASEPEVEVEIEEAFESGNRWPLMLTLVALAFFGLVAYAVWPATELPVRSVVDIDVATGGEKESTEAVSTESQGETLEYSSESIRSQLGSQAGSQQEPGSESNKESFDTINPENIEADWIDYSMPDSISEQEPEPEVDSDFFDSEDIEDFKENAEDVISEENLINEENFENAVDAEEHGEFDKNFERNIESSFFGLWQRGDIRKEAVEVSPAPEVVHYSDELEERLLTARSIVDSMAKEEKAAGPPLEPQTGADLFECPIGPIGPGQECCSEGDCSNQNKAHENEETSIKELEEKREDGEAQERPSEMPAAEGDYEDWQW